MIEVQTVAYDIFPDKPVSQDLPQSRPQTVQPTAPVAEKSEFSQMIGPLLKYLSIGIVIGGILMMVQLQFFM